MMSRPKSQRKWKEIQSQTGFQRSLLISKCRRMLIRIPTPTRINLLHSIINGFFTQRWRSPPKTLKMEASHPIPTDPCAHLAPNPHASASALGFRPALENKVIVTILQHILESKHPLNSSRIAKLGLQYVSVTTVTGVNVDARYPFWLLEPVLDSDWGRAGYGCEVGETQKQKIEDVGRLSSDAEDMGLIQFEGHLRASKGESSSLDESKGGGVVENVDELVTHIERLSGNYLFPKDSLTFGWEEDRRNRRKTREETLENKVGNKRPEELLNINSTKEANQLRRFI